MGDYRFLKFVIPVFNHIVGWLSNNVATSFAVCGIQDLIIHVFGGNLRKTSLLRLAGCPLTMLFLHILIFDIIVAVLLNVCSMPQRGIKGRARTQQISVLVWCVSETVGDLFHFSFSFFTWSV